MNSPITSSPTNLSTIASWSTRTSVATAKNWFIWRRNSVGDVCSASSVEPRTSANSRLHGISAPARCLTMSLKHMAQYFGFFSHGPLPTIDITLAHPPCSGDAQSLQWTWLGKILKTWRPVRISRLVPIRTPRLISSSKRFRSSSTS